MKIKLFSLPDTYFERHENKLCMSAFENESGTYAEFKTLINSKLVSFSDSALLLLDGSRDDLYEWVTVFFFIQEKDIPKRLTKTRFWSDGDALNKTLVTVKELKDYLNECPTVPYNPEIKGYNDDYLNENKARV